MRSTLYECLVVQTCQSLVFIPCSAQLYFFCYRVVVFQSPLEARNKVNGSVPLLTAELSACDVYATRVSEKVWKKRAKNAPLAQSITGLSLQAPNLLLFPCPSSRPISSVVSDLRERARTARNVLLAFCFRRYDLAHKQLPKKILDSIDQFIGVPTFKCNLCCIDATWRDARAMANLNADFFGDKQVRKRNARYVSCARHPPL